MENRPDTPRPQTNIMPPLKYTSGDIWSQDEAYLVKRRNHPLYLLLYTIGGEGMLTYGGKEYRITPGAAFLIDCREEQTYRTAREKWDFVFIHFDTEILKEYVDRLRLSYGPVFRPTDGSALETLMRAAISLFRDSAPAAGHRAFGLLAEILSLLYASAEEARKTARITPQTEAVLRLINQRCADRLTLDEIARQVGYSKYYLAHHFKRDMGVSLYEYLTLMRISRSKLLLVNTNLSVSDVAAEVGFSSVSNFIRTFSQYETLTPHRYRKQWQ